MQDRDRRDLLDRYTSTVVKLNRLMYSSQLSEWHGLEVTIPQVKVMVTLGDFGQSGKQPAGHLLHRGPVGQQGHDRTRSGPGGSQGGALPVDCPGTVGYRTVLDFRERRCAQVH